MIVLSKTRYLPTSVNILVLHKEHNYYYIHRDIYDKAIIISDRYSQLEVLNNIGCNSNMEGINFFYQNAPYPINALAPFIGVVNQDLEVDIEILTGVIHVITLATDPLKYLEIEKTIRMNLQFSLEIKEEYKLSWDRFFTTAIPFNNEMMTILRGASNVRDARNFQLNNIESSTESEKIELNQEEVELDKLSLDKLLEKERLKEILDVD